VQASNALRHAGVMSHTGHVNFSVRLDGPRMLLTARGTIDQIDEDTLAVVGFDGQVEHGEPDASTLEIVGMHAAVYGARGDVRAVVHTHSPYSTAFALARRPLPCRYEALLRQGQRRTVPVVPWAPRGSQAFFAGIVDALGEEARTFALLLANHGVLAFGSAAMATAKVLMTVEEAAEAELRAAALGGAQDLPDEAFAGLAPTAAPGGDGHH
jgi:L-fuculose-phosphate aldolase